MAGFSSSRGGIVDQTVDFWNSSFGVEESLEYPDKVLKCLSTLRKKKMILLPHFPLALEDESNISCQEPLYDIAREEVGTSTTEVALPVPTAPIPNAETNSREIQQTRSRKGSDTSDTIKPKVEQNVSATDENEILLSQQSQLDSQLLAENQSYVGKHTVEQLNPEKPTDSPLAAEVLEESSNDLSGPEFPRNKNAASGYSPRIARGTFFREFSRLNERNNCNTSPQSSAEAYVAAIDEDLTETAPQEKEADSENSNYKINFQTGPTSTSGKIVAPIYTIGEDRAVTASIENENLSEDQLLIERSTFVSSTPPSSDIDTVMIADSLLLPSKENHAAVDRERFSTPLESVDAIDSSSAEDASTPWQAYLNSSPPTSVGNDGVSTMERGGADDMHDVYPPYERNASEPQLPVSSHGMQRSLQKITVPTVIDMEQQGSEDIAQNEESSTMVSDDLLKNTNIIAGELPAVDEHATSTSKSMTGSHKDWNSPTTKHSLVFAESEEGRKRLRQDDLSLMHVGVDTADLDLARSAPIDVYQEKKDETSRASIQEESPIPTNARTQEKSRDVDLISEDSNCDQNSSTVNLRTSGADIPEIRREESSLQVESKITLKRRRSRRYEIDIEHIQLTTPKRRKRSTTERSIEHIQIPSVEQESGSPCSRAAQMQIADNGNGNLKDQDIIIDRSEAVISDKTKDSIRYVNCRTNETTQEANTTNTDIDPRANNDDHHSIPIALLNVPGPISPSDSSTPSSSQSTPSRAKAKPASIIGRLKRVLSDCKQLVLGSQEEREFDDVLFEVRKEVHEAGRRGRDGGG